MLCYVRNCGKSASSYLALVLLSGADIIYRQASADGGCHGCIVLHHAWVYAKPDLESRRDSQLDFNKSTGNLWIHIFNTGVRQSGVTAIDVFTLPSE